MCLLTENAILRDNWNKTVDWDKKNKVGIYAERNDENVENGP
jgi:hypothetical protein